MMIKKIFIQNFRSWEKVKFELSNGINIFVGNSSQGKSNINRALDWIINNRPAGDSYRSHWALRKETKRGESFPTVVSLETTDRYLITKKKSKSENLYSIEFNGNTDYLRAFGNSVPEEVTNILNIQEINTQFQLDPPFLLGLRPADIAKYLNEIAHLSSIDKSYAGINKLRIQTRSDLKYANQELEKNCASMEAYEYLEKAEELLSKLEQMEGAVSLSKIDQNTLTDMIISAKENERFLSQFPTSFEKSIKELSKLEINSKKLNQKIAELKGDKEELKDLIENIKKNKKFLGGMPRSIPNQIEYLNGLENHYASMEILTKEMKHLNDILDSIERLNMDLKKRAKDIEELELELRKLMPNKCPIYEQKCPLKEN